MTLQDLQREIHQLSTDDQLVLLETLVQALKSKHRSSQNSSDKKPPDLKSKASRRELVDQLRGCLKVEGKIPPTDEDIAQMLEDRLVEKYLK